MSEFYSLFNNVTKIKHKVQFESVHDSNLCPPSMNAQTKQFFPIRSDCDKKKKQDQSSDPSIPKSYQSGSSTLGSSRGIGWTLMVPRLLVNMAATWRGVGAGSVLSSLNTGPTMTTPRECSSG